MIWTTLFFLTGTFLVPFAFQYTTGSIFSVAIVVGFWEIMYGPCFLIGVGHMVSAAADAKEFANSLQTSFGNLGVSMGTAAGGWFINHYGISITPWVGIGFGVLALIVILWRTRMRSFISILLKLPQRIEMKSSNISLFLSIRKTLAIPLPLSKFNFQMYLLPEPAG